MRAHRQIVLHQSIEELLHGQGCPFCRFLKAYQAIHLQGDFAKEIRRLCNFHAWGVAAVQDTQAAAEVFLGLVNENGSIAEWPRRDRSGWGALGKAAEFLVAQRGLRA